MLKLDKMDESLYQDFMRELNKALESYVYTGKSDTPNGLVDAYVHLVSPDVVDELVIYNSNLMALYTLKGQFTAEELQKINKKP